MVTLRPCGCSPRVDPAQDAKKRGRGGRSEGAKLRRQNVGNAQRTMGIYGVLGNLVASGGLCCPAKLLEKAMENDGNKLGFLLWFHYVLL